MNRQQALDAGGFDVALSDGRMVHIRSGRPTDEQELLQMFERMGQEARCMRFMHVVRELDLQRLRAVLAPSPDGAICVVATVLADDGIDIVGSATAVTAGERQRCEFATTVAADFGGVGLATELMTTLIGAATTRGFQQMEGFVLAVNRPMLRLAKRLGFGIGPDPDDASVRICRMTLGSASLEGR